jgi:hypothetical protein
MYNGYKTRQKAPLAGNRLIPKDTARVSEYAQREIATRHDTEERSPEDLKREAYNAKKRKKLREMPLDKRVAFRAKNAEISRAVYHRMSPEKRKRKQDMFNIARAKRKEKKRILNMEEEERRRIENEGR